MWCMSLVRFGQVEVARMRRVILLLLFSCRYACIIAHVILAIESVVYVNAVGIVFRTFALGIDRHHMSKQ